MNKYEPYLHNRPAGTEAEQKAFATDALHTFFNDYDLNECHDNLWQIMKQSFFAKHWRLNNEQRANLINFYEELHRMILASSILYSRRKNDE